jgi:pyridoxal 5'-phosphate synthase pdxS subunit
MEKGSWRVKTGLAQTLKGGVIMDVVTPEHAKIAEEAGACAVMALERVPADIRAAGGVARMADPTIIIAIKEAVSIPVMAKCRIGHFVEAQILEGLGVDFVDESEVLTPADESHHIWKHDFKVPFVCGCRDLGEALRRIAEGAAMIRTKGEAGTGNIVEAVRHMRAVQDGIRRLHALPEDELVAEAKALGAPLELVIEVHKTGKLPVVNFAAGGVATPADAATGSRGSVCRLRDFQVQRSGNQSTGHRQGYHPLPGPGYPRSGIQRFGSSYARSGHKSYTPARVAFPQGLVR